MINRQIIESVEAMRPRLERYAANRVRNQQTAEVIASEAIIRLLEKNKPIHNPAGLLNAIARNLIKDYFRKRQSQENFNSTCCPQRKPLSGVALFAASEMATKALRILSSRDRDVVFERLSGHDLESIREKFGFDSKDQVRQLLARSLRKVRREVERMHSV